MGMLQAVQKELEHELASTRRVLQAVPDDRLAWTPHPKSRTMGQLALHIAGIPGMVARSLAVDELQANLGMSQPSSTAEVLAIFDANAAALMEALGKTDDASTKSIFTMKRGDHVIFQFPRTVMLRSVLCNHMYHHRGQLTVYLRLCDVPVPGIYGPSADSE